MPSDDEIVRAIVGTTGDSERRAEADAITRELLLPRLPRTDVAQLRAELRALQLGYEGFRDSDPADAFLRFAVFEEVSNLAQRAQTLAFVRLKQMLWPTEPSSEAWSSTASVDPATVPGAAAALHFRLRELEGRYASRLPWMFSHGEVEIANHDFGTHRTVVLARNHLHVALTGDYSVTTAGIFDELKARGIKTTTVLENRPF